VGAADVMAGVVAPGPGRMVLGATVDLCLQVNYIILQQCSVRGGKKLKFY